GVRASDVTLHLGRWRRHRHPPLYVEYSSVEIERWLSRLSAAKEGLLHLSALVHEDGRTERVRIALAAGLVILDVDPSPVSLRALCIVVHDTSTGTRVSRERSMPVRIGYCNAKRSDTCREVVLGRQAFVSDVSCGGSQHPTQIRNDL